VYRQFVAHHRSSVGASLLAMRPGQAMTFTDPYQIGGFPLTPIPSTSGFPLTKLPHPL
jgi:hypothetical protein